MKIVRSNELIPYSPAGHYNMLAQRVHSKDTSGTDMLTMGLSWFLPGGGAENNVVGEGSELIYYIVEGEMTLTANGETTVLHAGDSAYFKAGDARSVVNESTRPAAMMVVAASR